MTSSKMHYLVFLTRKLTFKIFGIPVYFRQNRMFYTLTAVCESVTNPTKKNKVVSIPPTILVYHEYEENSTKIK